MKANPKSEKSTSNSSRRSKPFFQKSVTNEPFFNRGENEKPFFSPSPLGNHSSIQKKENKDLPEEVQTKMEVSLEEDFSDVSIHKNSSEAKKLNALAFTQGEDIHFAPGQFNPNSHKGQELIGHELTHVKQQRQGRVTPTIQRRGYNISDDNNLEREANNLVFNSSNSIESKTSQKKTSNLSKKGVIQRKLKIEGSTDAKRKDFIKKINEGSTMKFELDKSGFLQQKYMPQIPVNEYDTQILNAIHDSQAVTLKLIGKSDSIFIDSFASGEVDVDDMLGMSADIFRSWLLHFVVERFATKDYEKNKATATRADFLKAHTAGHESQERFLKEKYPKKTIKYKSEGFDSSSKKVNKAGDGTINYVFDFTDVQYVFTQPIVKGVTLENITKSKIKIIK